MRRDTVVGLFSLIVGGLYGAETLRIRSATIGNPWAPRVFPLGISLFLMVLGLAVLLFDRKNAKIEGGGSASKRAAKDPGYVKLIVGAVILCGLYGFVFEPFGYILSTLCFMFLLLMLVNEPNRWAANAVITLIFTFALWGTFVYVFDIALPSFDLKMVKDLFGIGGAV
ncbi:MAG: tripartite tricarboxylate transporter TctB family protein [Synergistaceae bacterium]|jgi:putative tricarboxylic transport membrane protein|nr:tripartite tricarboxylate transporter TctB family protein [Synergistaceae bacterium]